MTHMNIALNKLLAWDGNVRKTQSDEGIAELAASIHAHGLLQSLVVRKDKRGKYLVVAGRRRMLALKSLVENGKLAATTPIPCHILDEHADASEISLAENVQREAMHPADEFEAFRELIDKGMPVADVAARFGVTETVVHKRLKLARVNPSLLALYRKGEMTLQHIMAFAVLDDCEVQERVWNQLTDWQKNDPAIIRRLLTEHEITAADRRVQFVTLKTYETAGGGVRRDLFSDGANGVFILDLPLLESLVTKKLENAAKAVRKEGWKWIEIRPSYEFEEWSGCDRHYPEPSPLPTDLQQEMESLTTEAEALAEIDVLSEEQQQRLDAINGRLDELEDRDSVWSPGTLALAGAIVSLGHDGEIDIRRGFVKPEDRRQQAPEDGVINCAASDNLANGAKSPSAALTESLTAHRSAALSASLLDHPEAALALLVQRLALPLFYNGPSEDSLIQITPRLSSLHRVESSPAFAAIETARGHWQTCLPSNSEALLDWCFTQDVATLHNLLAFCVAQTVNAVLLKGERASCLRMEQAKTLAAILNLDMAVWFTPDSGNYFGRTSKAAILNDLQEINGAVAPGWTAMKKTELASLAEREAARVKWIPSMLRSNTSLPVSKPVDAP